MQCNSYSNGGPVTHITEFNKAAPGDLDLALQCLLNHHNYDYSIFTRTEEAMQLATWSTQYQSIPMLQFKQQQLSPST